MKCYVSVQVTYLLDINFKMKIAFFCSKVIDFLAFFLPGASLSLRSCFGAMTHKRSLQKITKKNNRETQKQHTRARENTCMWQAEQREKGDRERPMHLACYPPSPCLCNSVSYITAHSNAYAWVGCACWVDSAVFGFLFLAFSALCRLSLTCARKTRISDSRRK